MTLPPTLRTSARIVVAILVGCSIAIGVGAARGSSRAPANPPIRKATAPKRLHVACSRDGSGKLQYRSDGTRPCRGRVIHFPKDGPVTACQLDEGNSQTYGAHAKLAPPAHAHAVAGMLFVVSGPGRCKAPKYPRSHPRTLPPTRNDLKLCAGERRGTLRVVKTFSRCNDLEFAVLLKKFNPNHPPAATNQSVDVDAETAKAITLSGTDPDGDTLAFSIRSGPSHGTLTGSGANRTYHPNANYAGPDSFVFTVADGRGGHATATVSITVKAPDEAPVVTTTSGSTPYTENAPAVTIDPGVTVSDGDDANLDGAAVVITDGFLKGADGLDFTDQSGISGDYQAATGELSLTGTASVSDYQTALRSVKFHTSAGNPWSSKTIDFTVGDGDKASSPASKTITITQSSRASR